MNSHRFSCLCLVALVLAAASTRADVAVVAPELDHELAVATFDSVWSIVNRTHFDPGFEGVDWKAVRAELRPRLDEVDTSEDLRTLLREMIQRIGLSHFALLDGEVVDALRADDEAGDDGADAVGDAEVGIALRLVGDDILVWQVRPGSSADRAGIQRGWALDAVGERRLADSLEKARGSVDDDQFALLAWMMVNGLVQGAEGSTVHLVFRDGEDRERSFDLVRETAPGVMNQLGNLPPMRAALRDERIGHEGADVGVIAFNIWLLPVMAGFDDAVDRYRDADGIVIDLRGNIGGVGAMAMGMAGHFMTERRSLGVMKTRTTRLEFKANPRLTNSAGERVQPFAGPVAILIDPMSMSTSEIFAQGLKSLGRARIFGEASPGAALPSQFTRLPNGDVLQHAFADFVDPEGLRLEGNGVLPDQSIPLRREDLLAGRDAPLLAALEWIAQQRHP